MPSLRRPTSAEILDYRKAAQKRSSGSHPSVLMSADPGPAGFDFSDFDEKADAAADGDFHPDNPTDQA